MSRDLVRGVGSAKTDFDFALESDSFPLVNTPYHWHRVTLDIKIWPWMSIYGQLMKFESLKPTMETGVFSRNRGREVLASAKASWAVG
jgi:hypothetical protein